VNITAATTPQSRDRRRPSVAGNTGFTFRFRDFFCATSFPAHSLANLAPLREIDPKQNPNSETSNPKPVTHPAPIFTSLQKATEETEFLIYLCYLRFLL